MKRLSVSIVGLGYVGLSTGVCLASRGIQVHGVDVDQAKVRSIAEGRVPFEEEGLQALLRSSLKKGLFVPGADLREAVWDSEITFLTVGTPSGPDGSIELSHLRSASEGLGRELAEKGGYHHVVVKSTVVPGTTQGLVKDTLERSSSKKCGEGFGLAANPEFLREGSAVADTFRPDAVVIGALDTRTGAALVSLYRRFYRKLPPVLSTSPANAELIKYASNTFRATQLSFLNTLANLCSSIGGADIDEVARGLSSIMKVDPRYLKAGLGFGGSCLPPSTKVQTMNGLEMMGQIELGERVLAHDGKYHTVGRIFSRHFEGNLVEIRGRGFYSFPIACTPEHPVLVGKRGFKGTSRWYRSSGRRKLKNVTKIHAPEFIPASEIEQGDFIYLPTPVAVAPRIPVIPYAAVYQHQRSSMIASVRATPELQYLFGIYIAEGTIWDREITWSLHKKELNIVQELDAITTKYFGHNTSVSSRRGNGITAKTKSKPLAAYLKETFGTLAWRKRIPHEWAVSLPEEQLVCLLRGLIRGDGSSSYGRYDLTTTSERLWNFVQIALLRLRIPFSVHLAAEEIDSHGVHHREAFILRITDIDAMNRVVHRAQRIERVRKKYNVSSFQGGYFAFPVRKVSLVPYSGEVKNLEVETANSYVLQGGTVHNCLPEDLRAIAAYSRTLGADPAVFEAALGVNEAQPAVAVRMAQDLVGGLEKKRVAVLGLAFKPDTDDVRESVAVRLVERLLNEGARVTACDPKALDNARRVLGDRVTYAGSARECIRDSDCCIVATGWPEFARLRPSDFKKLMRNAAVVDARRVLDAEALRAAGVKCATLGSGP